jgi:hypothetical protein
LTKLGGIVETALGEGIDRRARASLEWGLAEFEKECDDRSRE